MMSDEEALLRAVLVSPDDDVPRLVLADWLDEHAGTAECRRCKGKGLEYRPEIQDGGHWRCPVCSGTGRASDGRRDRAEFIRVQCELERREAMRPRAVPMTPENDARWDELLKLRGRQSQLWTGRRAAELWPDLGAAVTLDRRYRVESQPPATALAVCRRGFVDEIRLPAAEFSYRASELFRRHPITHTVLTDCVPHQNGYGYSWFWNGRLRPSDDVPYSAALTTGLFFGLRGWAEGVSERWRAYPTAAAALAALDAAATTYGRGAAGLDPFTAPPATSPRPAGAGRRR